LKIATTRLMPLHSGKGRTVAEALGRVTDYVENPEKTNGGDLVTAYQCNPSIADQEFLFSKRQYAVITGRERKDNDVIAYHLRQSFKPGEITPELWERAGDPGSALGTGGMHTKLKAAEIAMACGCDMIIANGRRPELLYDISAGRPAGTRFVGGRGQA